MRKALTRRSRVGSPQQVRKLALLALIGPSSVGFRAQVWAPRRVGDRRGPQHSKQTKESREAMKRLIAVAAVVLGASCAAGGIAFADPINNPNGHPAHPTQPVDPDN